LLMRSRASSPENEYVAALRSCYSRSSAAACGRSQACRLAARCLRPIFTPMNVKLLDLQSQYLPLRQEIRRAIDEVCDAQALILGPHVERFEKELAAYCG